MAKRRSSSCACLVRYPALMEQSHVRAVDPNLVDGLGCANTAKFGGPVGGEDDERHARLVRFDDGRKVVGGCGSRGADQRGRDLTLFGDSETEEAGGSLVVHHMACDAVFDGEGRGEGCAA